MSTVAARRREYQQRLRAKPVPPELHGTVTGYKNRGCRCDGCREAWRHYARQRNGAEQSRLAAEVARLRAENAALRTQLEDR